MPDLFASGTDWQAFVSVIGLPILMVFLGALFDWVGGDA